MRRVFFGVAVLVLLLLGAALGAIWSVQAGQIRAWMGASAPGWLHRVAADARLPVGTLQLDQPMPLSLRWSDPHLPAEQSGWVPQWRLDLRGPGLQVRGLGQPGPEQVALTLQQAELDLALLAPETLALSGRVTLLTGTALVNWRRGRVHSGTARGLAQDLTLAGRELGDFGVKLTLRPLQWVAELTSLPENPLRARAEISRLVGQNRLALDLRVEDTPDLNPEMRRVLSRIGTESPDGGWQILQDLPLR